MFYTCVVRAVGEDHIDILQPKALQGLLGAFDDAVNVDNEEVWHRAILYAYTHCFRDRPMSLGPLRVPQKSLVVTIKSVRRKLSSLITRPLNVLKPCQPLSRGFVSRTTY